MSPSINGYVYVQCFLPYFSVDPLLNLPLGFISEAEKRKSHGEAKFGGYWFFFRYTFYNGWKKGEMMVFVFLCSVFFFFNFPPKNKMLFCSYKSYWRSNGQDWILDLFFLRLKENLPSFGKGSERQKSERQKSKKNIESPKRT